MILTIGALSTKLVGRGVGAMAPYINIRGVPYINIRVDVVPNIRADGAKDTYTTYL